MKKLLSLLLVALCAVIVVPLSACNEEVETITLTTDNYNEYIMLTSDFDNVDVEYISSNNYFISCVYYVTATPKGDYKFNDVELYVYCSYESSSIIWHNLSNTNSSNSVLSSYMASKSKNLYLDYYGNGRKSTYVYQTSTSAAVSFSLFSNLTIEVLSISGTVTV